MIATTLRVKKSVDDVWPLTGKRVLLRVDFNVPIRNGVIDNDYRIRSSIPTIRRIVNQGGVCILLSHLGRPAGVDSDAVDADLRTRRNSNVFQENRGKTAFFASLSGEEKALILSWSSRKEKAASVPVQQGSGKTAIFGRLPEEEKKQLLVMFLNENKERLFPQLTSTAGFEEDCSLQVVAVRLAELLGQHVYFAHDCLFAKHEIMKLRCGEIMLLENVRFYKDENSPIEEKRMKMAKVLASYGDIYMNDAFGTAHRDSATMTGIPRIMGHGAAGYLMEREISFFSKVLNNPPRPLVAVIGGTKLSEKMALLECMLNRIDYLIIGGGMAYTFLVAEGYRVGTSLYEDSYVEQARNLMRIASDRKVDVFLPSDHICNLDPYTNEKAYVTDGANVPRGHMALDIGPKTIVEYTKVIDRSKAAVWSGAMGVFEVATYAKGTYAIAKAMGNASMQRGLLSIVGGGDSATAAEKCGEGPRMSHVSTGYRASMQLLEGHPLPGVDVLDDKE